MVQQQAAQIATTRAEVTERDTVIVALRKVPYFTPPPNTSIHPHPQTLTEHFHPLQLTPTDMQALDDASALHATQLRDVQGATAAALEARERAAQEQLAAVGTSLQSERAVRACGPKVSPVESRAGLGRGRAAAAATAGQGGGARPPHRPAARARSQGPRAHPGESPSFLTVLPLIVLWNSESECGDADARGRSRTSRRVCVPRTVSPQPPRPGAAGCRPSRRQR
jgi:hypothetical protein